MIDLNIIVKADVQGTAEAVKASLEKIDVDGVRAVSYTHLVRDGKTITKEVNAKYNSCLLYTSHLKKSMMLIKQ